MEKHLNISKSLVVIGAGRANLGICRAAKNMGLNTVVVTKENGDYPCLEYADHVVIADILEPKMVIEALADFSVGGVVSACSDRPLITQAYLIENIGLKGISSFVAEACYSKEILKRRLMDHGVSISPYRLFKDFSELNCAVKELGFPLVIKPVEGQGSAGVNIIFTLMDLHQWVSDNSIKSGEVWIAEKYITNPYEFGAQAFVEDGKVIFFALHNDELFSSEKPIPVRHVFPFQFFDKNNAEIVNVEAEEETRKAISALGILNGAVNIDFIYSEGRVYVLELTNRVGANGIAEAVSCYFGIEYYEFIIYAALGISVMNIWKLRKRIPSPTISQMIYPPVNSFVSGFKIGMPSSSLVSEENFVNKKRFVNEISSSADAIGQLILSGKNLPILLNELDAVLSYLKFV